MSGGAVLPNPKTRFFGREGDLARLAALAAEGAPIVTLWGPPGIGKTRLAIELCRRGGLTRTGAPIERAWFCDLGAARDVGAACAAVLEAIAVAPRAGVAAPAWVSAALAAMGPAAIVLDDAEHVAAIAAQTIGAWADAAPQVLFLVTSRARLHLDGEITHEVTPLREARELFVDRARARAGADAIDPDAVAAIATRLEGIPLAIELAAARLDVLGVDGLVGKPLGLLDRADAPGRTLRDAIDASFRVLSHADRSAFAQCAVFRGPFTLDSAEQVIQLDGATSVVDALERLRDRSLLRRVPSEGAARFATFAAVRAFAYDALVAGGRADEVRARHARHVLGAANAGPADVLDAAAFVLARDDASPSDVADVVRALARVDASSAPDDLVDRLSDALALAERRGVGGDVRALGHRALGRALQSRGRLGAAAAAIEASLGLATDDEDATAEAWIELGLVHHQARDLVRAQSCYEAALARLGDRPGAARARCIGDLGAVHHDARRWDEALDHYARAIDELRAVGERRLEGIFLANTAILLVERGALARAAATYALALERLAESGDRRLEAIARTNLGSLHHERGDLHEARRCHEAALEVFSDVVDPRSLGLCLGRLAMALAALGDAAAARACGERAARILGALDDRVSAGALDLFRAFVDLASGADELFVRARLDAARAPVSPSGAPLVDVSDDARTAMRLIEAALAARDGGAGVLVLGRDAAWFAPPDGAPCDLARRRVLRRLLAALAARHRDAPGEGMTLDALREAGWPDERALPEAAMNRVHVALAELRRRGLKRWLLRKHARYLIHPALRVEIRDA